MPRKKYKRNDNTETSNNQDTTPVALSVNDTNSLGDRRRKNSTDRAVVNVGNNDNSNEASNQITPGTVSAHKNARLRRTLIKNANVIEDLSTTGGIAVRVDGIITGNLIPDLMTPPTQTAMSGAKRRLLFESSTAGRESSQVFVPVTPAKPKVTLYAEGDASFDNDKNTDDTVIKNRIAEKSIKRQHDPMSPAKRRLFFGRTIATSEVTVNSNVRKAYKIIRQRTGSIGGNGCFGPIYGELTMGSMQRMINCMKQYTQFNETSTFIDVGCGIGKPNIHVSQDPGVQISYGIECEESRWMLGMSSLYGIVQEIEKEEKEQLERQEHQNDHTTQVTNTTSAVSSASTNTNKSTNEKNKGIIVDDKHQRIQCNCIFVLGDIKDANTFNPFTHVYMFSIGFPPSLWFHLAGMWNRSVSNYLICYHGPRDIIDSYEFHVELVTQLSTSMHGSKENHTGYIYKRTNNNDAILQKQEPKRDENEQKQPSLPESTTMTQTIPCDPYYKKDIDIIESGFLTLKNVISGQMNKTLQDSPTSKSLRSHDKKKAS